MADVCDGLYRADEKDSIANEAYDNAFEEAVGGGFGAWRLRADYEDHENDEDERQRILIEPIYDADSSVWFDLDAKRQDKADAKVCFVINSLTYDSYIEEYGDDPASWPKTVHQYEFDWLTPDVVYVAEYYRVEEVGETVRRLVDQGAVDHIDMNFGCPVPKVTKHGGGAALPVRHRLLRRIVRAAVDGAGDIPVTIKFRMGVDDDIMTFIETGLIGEDEGCAAIALHARTAEQLYSGHARWHAIGELKQAVTSIPVLGNGDIWEPADALAMMRETDCDGVVIGRGCLGRPWLFSALAAAFDGQPLPELPSFAVVSQIMLRHAEMLVDWYGNEGALRQFRKHALWYLMGFPIGGDMRNQFARFTTLAELRELVELVDPSELFPPGVLRQPRSHSGGPRVVHLPEGWLADRDNDQPPGGGADSIVSGG